MSRAIRFQREANGVLVFWNNTGPASTFIPDDEWDAIYAFTSRGEGVRGDSISPTRTTPNRDPLDVEARSADTEARILQAFRSGQRLPSPIGREATIALNGGVVDGSGSPQTGSTGVQGDLRELGRLPKPEAPKWTLGCPCHSWCEDCETYHPYANKTVERPETCPRFRRYSAEELVWGESGERDERPVRSDSDVGRLVRALRQEVGDADEAAASDAERHSRLMESQGQPGVYGTSESVAPPDPVTEGWTHSG